ncbi:MAG: rhomboid family intramembrane serine protease [Flavobacteriaceae bacterium]|jgi:membrane associated rhomboid family serine protease|nr:rhomboid family intramembrane serine protease [Flavobacteriaceae bacterium]MBT5091727.1 rhomboid family intramembrane serine protease [Flavobacteriaceae bacterium]MBT5283257.1 rhomboid family intramembrane serine protease [Flavobacteriaceae bacterium]
MNFKDQIQYRIQRLNSAEKLILINVVCFVLPLFLRTLFFLLAIPFDAFLSWFELSSEWSILLFQPWSLVTYSFIHSGFFHLFWNMYLLFFASRLFLNLFPPRFFFNVYFIGVIIGGLTFLLSYSLFPAFQNSTPVMIGASAGVMAVFIFMSTYSPDHEVRIILFNVKLRYLGLAFILLDVIQIPYGNAGGHLAHLGGAALGFFYAQRLQQGIDIGLPFERFVTYIIDFFRKKPSLKTVYKSKSSTKKPSTVTTSSSRQKKIDEILDKISTSGYDSLTKDEKDFLFQAGKE